MNKNSTIYKTVLLGGVCGLAGICLSAVNTITKPIIEENSMAAVKTTLNEFFPGGTFKEVTAEYADKDKYPLVDAIYEAEGAGYAFTLHNTGYSSSGFKFAIAFNNDGSVAGYTGLEQNETAGKGSKAFDPEYAEEVKKLSSFHDMPLISGATVTTVAVNDAVKQAEEIFNGIVGLDSSGFVPEPTPSTTGGDDTFSAKGFLGEVTAKITVEGGKVVEITELDGKDNDRHTADNDYFAEGALDIYKGATGPLDVISGATITGNAINAMVEEAIAKAAEGGSSASGSGFSAKGFMGELTADIEVKDGAVVAITNLKGADDDGHSADGDYFKDGALDIYKGATGPVDVISGSTATGNAINEMVKAALAGGDTGSSGSGMNYVAKGFMGDLTADIEVKDGAVVAITNLKGADDDGHSADGDYFKDGALDIYKGATGPVDVISGSTATGKAINEMVEQALAGEDGASEAAGASYTAKGFMGDLTATIEVKDGAVVAITNLEGLDDDRHTADNDYFAEGALDMYAGAKGPIDVISGSTFTGNAINEMVKAALAAGK